MDFIGEKIRKDGRPKAVITKTMNGKEEYYNIWIHYGREYPTSLGLLNKRIGGTNKFNTEQDVAYALKKKLEEDRSNSGLPNLTYELDLKIIHILEEPGTSEEIEGTRKSIEKLLLS